MKYQFEFTAVVALTPVAFNEICPNMNPQDSATENTIKEYFQKCLNDLIDGKYVTREKYEMDVASAKYSYEVKQDNWDK